MCVASVHTHVCALFTRVCVASVHTCVCGTCVWPLFTASVHTCVWPLFTHVCGTLFTQRVALCSHMCAADFPSTKPREATYTATMPPPFPSLATLYFKTLASAAARATQQVGPVENA